MGFPGIAPAHVDRRIGSNSRILIPAGQPDK